MYFESKVQGVETPSQVRYVGYVWGLIWIFSKNSWSPSGRDLDHQQKHQENQVERLLRKQAALEVPGLLHHGLKNISRSAD